MKHFIISLFCVLIFASCNYKQNDSQPQTQNSSIVGVNASLTSGMDSQENQIVSLNSTTNKQEAMNVNTLLWIIVGVLTLLTIALIITVYKFATRSSELDELIDDVSLLKSKLNKFINDIKNTSNNNQSGQYTAIDNYTLNQIESRIAILERNAANSSLADMPPAMEEVEAREAFFGNVMIRHDGLAFFCDKYDSYKEEAVFKAQIKGNTGTIELIDINRIQSSNINDKAIKRVNGSAAISEANGFQLISRGKVHFERKEGLDIWVLDEPVTIKLI